MDVRRRVAGRSAPYGQACESCFKCKCKCIVRPGGDGCERCHRLNKQCQPGDSLRRRAGDRNQKANARIAELEGRLEGLVSLLHSRNVLDDHAAAQAQQRTRVEESEHPTSTHSSSTPPLGSVENDDDRDNLDEMDFGNGNDHYGGDDNAVHPSTDSPEHVTALTLTTAASEPLDIPVSARLETFWSRMLPQFPFIHLPADLDASQLQRDRPFLLLSIICVTSPSASEKRARAAELKRMLSETVFLAPQQHGSIDLLLGLLVYTAWGWDHVLSRSSLSRLMMMAMSLVGEMHLDKPAPHAMGLFPSGLGERSCDEGSELTTGHFLERQRAVLGCFVLSSAVSAYFGEVEGLRWTPRMEEGLAAIFAHKVCPDDEVLAMQVRLQLLAMKAAQFRDQQQTDQIQGGGPDTPVVLHTKALLGQLQELRACISSTPQNRNDILMSYTYHTELRILEGATRTPSRSPDAPCTGPPSSAPAVLLPSDHLSCLWKAELAVNSAATALLTLPAPGFLGASFVQWAQWAHLAHCVAVLYRLTALYEKDAGGLDPAAARAIAELPAVLDRVADKLQLAAGEAGEIGPDDVFTQLAGWMRVFREGVQSREDGGGRVEPRDGAVAAQKGLFRGPWFWIDPLFSGVD